MIKSNIIHDWNTKALYTIVPLPLPPPTLKRFVNSNKQHKQTKQISKKINREKKKRARKNK